MELGDQPQAAQLLERTMSAAEGIEDDWSKSSALSGIAAATVELGDQPQAAQLLERAMSVTEGIEADGYKSDALSGIIKAIDQLPNQVLRQELLGAALQSANSGDAFVPMVKIAALYAKQSQWGKALAALRNSQESKKIVGLTQIFTTQAEHKNLRLIRGAIVIPEGAQGLDVTDDSGNYTFEVTVQSPDENCSNYADWVEVINPDGKLKRREVYSQPHLDVPTFSATLTSVDIQPDEEVIIRAHFHGTYASGEDPLVDSVLRERIGGRYEKSGYTDQALRGSVVEGFKSVRISEQYANWLEKKEPLPAWEECEIKR